MEFMDAKFDRTQAGDARGLSATLPLSLLLGL
jgi:hypothetical protein